jgi:hypothetical protein
MIVAYFDAGDIKKPLAQDMMKLFQDKKYPVLFVCERVLAAARNGILVEE